jgi:hypothetical protein
MTITLPSEIRAEAEAKAKAAGFSSVEAYIAALIAEDMPEEDLLPPDYTPPPELTPRSREELERMLDEGIASGNPIRVTPEFWAERRRVLEEKIAARKRASS